MWQLNIPMCYLSSWIDEYVTQYILCWKNLLKYDGWLLFKMLSAVR